MRICLICTEKLPVPPVRGGAIQTYIAGVLPYLEREHEVTVVCRRDPQLRNREVRGQVRYERVPAGNRPEEYFRNVGRFLRSQPPFDAVIQYNRPAWIPVLLRHAGSARLILSMHNDMFNPDRLPAKTAEMVLELVSDVVTISDYVGGVIGELYPDYRGKLRTVRSGVDIDRFVPPWMAPERRAEVRRRLGLGEGPVVLHVGRLSPKKGNHLVVEAMERVMATHPDAQLVMVGSSRYGSNHVDPYGRSVLAKARRLGAKLLGFVPPDQVSDIFLAGDIFVNASQWQEPLARVHYEAMAAGLPIITTDRGGNGEVVTERQNGIFARPYDAPEGYVGAIRWLLDHPEYREQMGRVGRTLAEERYTWERVARELLAVITGR